MLRRLVGPIALVLVLLLGASVPLFLTAAPAEAAKSQKARKSVGTADPETVIRNIYKQYDKTAGPAEAQQMNFTEDLYKLWIDVQAATRGFDDVGVDFDVFLDAQGLDEVRNLSTKFTPDGDQEGKVTARFACLGKTKTITYTMTKTGRGWKIDNISYGPKRKDLRTLLAILKKNGGQMSN
jgi:polyisoprenoid-binding protein YceI